MPGPEAFLPRRVPITAYGKGGFGFEDMRHEGSLLILADGVHRWRPETLDELEIGDFAALFAEAAPGSFLLLGTGPAIARPARAIREAFSARGIGLDFMDTGAAVRTWNVLVAENRAACAAFLRP